MPHKIRLGLCMFTPAIGGAEQQLRDLLWHLDRERFSVTVFINPWRAFEDFLGLTACPATTVVPVCAYDGEYFCRRLSRYPRTMRRAGYLYNIVIRQFTSVIVNFMRLKTAFQTTPVDVLHIINGGYPGSVTCRIAAIAARAAGVPSSLMTIASTPQALRWPNKPAEAPLESRVHRSLDRYVCVAKHAADVLIRSRGIPESKMSVIYYGIPGASADRTPEAVAKARRQFGLSDGTTVLAVIARLSPEKGHEHFLTALQSLRTRYGDGIKTLFVGDGPLLPELRNRVAALALQGSVEFCGRLPHERVSDVLAATDIVVLPSTMEGLPYAITEAMSAARPVVASRIGGIPEQIVDGETGLLVPPADPQALAAALTRLIDDPAWARKMGENGQRRFRDVFTLSEMITHYEKLYNDLHTARNR